MSKRNAAPAPADFQPGQMISRALDLAPSSYNATARTVDAVFSTGAPVRRYGIIEVLEISAEAVDLTRAASGRMAALFNHNQDDPIGVVITCRIENGAVVGTIRFNDTPRGREIEGMVARGELSTLSVGYRISAWRMLSIENDVETWAATRWEIYEASFAPVPADFNSTVRSVANPQATTAETQETDDMRRNAAPAPGAPAVENTETRAAPVAATAPAAPAAPAAPNVDLVAAERARAAAILEIAQRAGLAADVSATAIESGEAVDAFRARAFEHLVGQPHNAPISTARSTVGQDETETRRVAMGEAMIRGLAPGALDGDPSAAARQYMGLNLVSLAAERLGERRVPDTFAARESVLRRAMHSTSDFPVILENALNRSVARRYTLATPTYREFAARQDFNDFRPHTTVRVGDFPMLESIGEGGEIKYGTLGEGKESVAVGSYARAVRLSRQLLVNDNLGAIGDVLGEYGQTVALLEEVVSYGILGANSADGPTLIEGAAAMFTTTRTNKAGTATAINEAGLSAARAAMRKYKSIDGNQLLYNAPSILLVSPDKETEAEKMLTAVLAAQTSNVNVFSGKLKIVVGSLLSGNRWWLFADPSARANFRWGYLSGYDAPRTRIDEPFGQQGMAVSVEHDFGFGGIDWRAGYVNAGQ